MHDSHAHLTIDPISTNVISHLKEFKENGGEYILNVSFSFESINEVITQSLKFEKIYPNLVLTGVGIHPEEITGLTKKYIYKEIDKYIQYLEEQLKTHKSRISCIGECGLDYYHLYKSGMDISSELDMLIDAQKYTFRKHLELAIKYDLPVSIHTRDVEESDICTMDALNIISQIGKGLIKGSFHSYTGSLEMLKHILDQGFYVGFNGIITYPKGENVRKLLINTPIDRILIETDCPLLPPQKVRSGKSGPIKYGKPLDVIEISEYASEIKDLNIDDFKKKTLENFKALFLPN